MFMVLVSNLVLFAHCMYWGIYIVIIFIYIGMHVLNDMYNNLSSSVFNIMYIYEM